MDVAKFIVGVLTIAIGLWAAGQLAPSVVEVGRLAGKSSRLHFEFKIGNLNRHLNKK